MMNWLKDKTYYRSKCNNARLELKVQRDAFSTATLEWAKQLEEKEAEVQYWKKAAELRNKQLKTVKEDNKQLRSELEEYVSKKRK